MTKSQKYHGGHGLLNINLFLKGRDIKISECGLSRELLHKLYWHDNCAVGEIQKMFPGISIGRLMQDWDIPRRTTGDGIQASKLRKLTEKGVNRESLQELYIGRRMSCGEINKYFGCNVSNQTISKYLRYFGITIRTLSEISKGREFSPETRKKISICVRTRLNSGWHPNTLSAVAKTKELWKTNHDEMIKSRMINFHPKHKLPTYPEKQLQIILGRITPGTFEYTGNKQVLGSSKRPDFADMNGHRVIEMYGDYWHKGENPNDRIDMFSSIGYDCFVVWEHELKEKNKEQLLLRLNEWIKLTDRKSIYTDLSEPLY